MANFHKISSSFKMHPLRCGDRDFETMSFIIQLNCDGFLVFGHSALVLVLRESRGFSAPPAGVCGLLLDLLDYPSFGSLFIQYIVMRFYLVKWLRKK